MAIVVINNNTPVFTKVIERVSFPNVEITQPTAKVVINNNAPVFTKTIERSSFPNIEITQKNNGVAIDSVLPFRVRFTAIQVPSSIGNIPAIPLQIIGFSNYIL
jgi:hypothetical protein